MNILRQVSTNALLAFGMTLVMISGGIDLSIGSIVAVSGTFTIGLSVSGLPVIISIFIGIVAGTALGLINGLVIAKNSYACFHRDPGNDEYCAWNSVYLYRRFADKL